MAYGNNDPKRARQMRGNNRRIGTFRGGLGQSVGTPGIQEPRTNAPRQLEQPGQCPAGQRPVRDPRTGRMTCSPERQAVKTGLRKTTPKTYKP